MDITVKKTNIATNTASWDAILVDENGTNFATMSGKVDTTRPFGSVSLTVHNQIIFKANEESAKAAYAQFQNDFEAMVAAIEPITTTNEEGVITV